MAQLAIPLLALGGLYVIANQKEDDKDEVNKQDEKKVEGFKNKYPVNYPVVQQVREDNVNRYSNSNQTTDKFFKHSVSNNKKKEKKINDYQMSLTGDPIDQIEFKHNNMVPFYSGKNNGVSVSSELAEIKLDNMQGGGSQAFRKSEQAPLFKPQENVSHQYGAPNVSDFILQMLK